MPHRAMPHSLLTLFMRAGAVFAAALALGLLSPAARAQLIPGGPDIAPTAPASVSFGLLVHGDAEFDVMPDIAYVTVSVVTQSKDSTEASQENARRAEAVVDALKGAGIAPKDIQTLSYVLSPQYDYSRNTPILTGYQAANSIRVTVRSLPKLGPVIDAAVKAGANNVSDTSFDLSDRNRVEGETLVAAIADARRKADLMAGAAGVSLGSLLRMTEDTAPVVQPVFGRFAMAATPAQPAPTTPISPQQITVTADITAVYAILPLPGR